MAVKKYRFLSDNKKPENLSPWMQKAREPVPMDATGSLYLLQLFQDRNSGDATVRSGNENTVRKNIQNPNRIEDS